MSFLVRHDWVALDQTCKSLRKPTAKYMAKEAEYRLTELKDDLKFELGCLALQQRPAPTLQPVVNCCMHVCRDGIRGGAERMGTRDFIC